MIIGPILAGAGGVMLVGCALFALYDAGRAHFLRKAMVEGRTRMKIWPLWVGVAGGVLLFLASFFP